MPEHATDDATTTATAGDTGLRTIPALVDRNATEFGDLPALSTLDEPRTTVTWRELRDRAVAFGRGLADLGLEPGDRMLISASSRPEHWVADLGAVHLGAVPATTYATLSSPQLRYIAAHSKAKVIVAEDGEQLQRWLPVLDELPDLRHVVVLGSETPPEGPRFLTFTDVAARGEALHRADPSVLEGYWRAVTEHQPVTLLYTSGTTGDPKGVAISHHNVLFQAEALEGLIEIPAHAPNVAYLPLAHIAERVLSVYIPVFRAGHVHICPDPSKMVAALGEVRPAAFFGVPRVWEKLAAGIQGLLGGADEATRTAFKAASETLLEGYKLREAGEPVPADLQARIDEADATVLRPVRAMLGVDQVKHASSGAAPIPVEVLTFLAGIGLDVLEVWGMTETTGTATINLPTAFRTGTVGRPHVGTEIKLAEDGEILVRSPLVALGYLRADGSIEPIVDADGWLATGDIGTIDDGGYLTITDRKKEIIITAGGKNIAPAQIENALRSHPLIGHAVAIGDRRPYVTALVALDEEAAPVWAKAHGIEAGEGGLAAHPEVVAEIQRAVDVANERLARVEQVKKFSVLGAPWTPETGELTPTLKLRRRIINDRYSGVIDELYD